jgi:hypothetical protein
MRLLQLIENLNRTGQGKAAVVGWGRGMGHKGHMYLASSVITQANESDADPYFVVSRTVGKDDPITPEEKMQIYKKVFPKHGHIFHTATDEMPDLTRVLSQLDHHGYTDVTVVVGADQVKALSYVKHYNGTPDKAGKIPYSFNTLNVISRQETNDPSREEEGPRATPMRSVLTDPDATDEQKFQTWRDAMNPEISDDEVRDLMHKAHIRMQDFTKPKVRAKKEKAVAEMDKSQTPPGRDGHVSHSTYGSRDKKDPDAGKKEYTAKAITAKQTTDSATGMLNKVFRDSQRVDPRTGKKMVQKGVAEGLNEFAQGDFNGSDDSNDLQLYLNVAKKLNMKKYKPSTAHDLIAKKMAELVDAVDDEKVDWARHMARKAQGLPSMLDQQGVAEGFASMLAKAVMPAEKTLATKPLVSRVPPPAGPLKPGEMPPDIRMLINKVQNKVPLRPDEYSKLQAYKAFRDADSMSLKEANAIARSLREGHGGTQKMHGHHKAAIKNATTFPSMNQSTGSAYLGYRLGIALAGAPTFPTKIEADNWIGGDPLLAPYTEEENEMINAAAKQVGGGKRQTWSNNRSLETADVNKTSAIAKIKRNKYGI